MVLAIFPLLFPQAIDVSGTVSLGSNRPARQAVVFLEGGAHSTPLKKAVVDQRNRSFVPHVLVVTVGTEVQFPNNDTIFHNVFSASDINRFDLGVYPRGKTISRAFPKKGVVSLQCNIHSEMSAYIVVVDTPYYTLTDNKGTFRLDGVPQGHYTLRVWHESGYQRELPLVVESASNTPLSLVLRRR